MIQTPIGKPSAPCPHHLLKSPLATRFSARLRPRTLVTRSYNTHTLQLGLTLRAVARRKRYLHAEMLAAPLQPSAIPEARDLSQYRPAKDLEAFNTLLPPPIEFVEGSSSGTLAVAEGKYQAINGSGSVTPKPAKAQVRGLIIVPAFKPLNVIRSVTRFATSITI